MIIWNLGPCYITPAAAPKSAAGAATGSPAPTTWTSLSAGAAQAASSVPAAAAACGCSRRRWLQGRLRRGYRCTPGGRLLRRLRSHRRGWGRRCSEAGGGGRIAGGVYTPLIWAVRRLPCPHHHTPSHPGPIRIQSSLPILRPLIGAMRSNSCPPPRPLALSIATAAALSRVAGGRGAGAQGALGAEKARGQGRGAQPKSRLAHF